MAQVAGDILIARFVSVALAIAAHIVTAGQSDRALDAALQKLHAADWPTRSGAVDELAESPQMWKLPATRRALIELLDRENKFLRDPNPRQPIRSEAEGEAYARYHSTLLGRVEPLVDPDDVRSVSVLVQSVYSPDSPLALRLASYGQTVVPALLEIIARRNADDRSDSYEVLGQVLRQHRLGTSRHPLTAQAVRDVESRLRTGLLDPAPSVRVGAIRGVKAAGDLASVPVLEQLRTSDPFVLDTTGRFWIREQAAKAIAAIQANPLGK